MRLRRHPRLLELTDAVGCYTMLAIAAAIVGAIVFVGLGDLIAGRQPLWVRASALIAVATVIGAIAFLAEKAHTTTVSFVDGERQIIIRKHRPLTRRVETLLVDVRDVDEAFVEKSTDSDGDSFYYVTLRLRRGDTLRLSDIGEGASASKERAVAAINQYLVRERQ